MGEQDTSTAASPSLPLKSGAAAAGARKPRPPKRGRPAFVMVVIATGGWRLGREGLELLARSRFGPAGALVLGVLGVAVVLLWRWNERRRVRQRGDVEFTQEQVAEQIETSELGPPAFEEDGTLFGASILVMNQRPKILEVQTHYDLFGSGGRRLGDVRQIAQSQSKQAARVLTGFDQFMTHHFEVEAADGVVLLRITRPRKFLRTKVHVFDGQDHYLGTLRQENVFWKIRFEIVDAAGSVVGLMRAENLRAWDFEVRDAHGRSLATVIKSWEGWGKTAFTRADSYVIRVHQRLPFPARELVLASALAVDLALKQDARGIG